MNITIGIVMLVIGIGMILLGMPRSGEDRRPFLHSPFVYAIYPSIILIFLPIGLLTVLTNL